MKIVRLSSTNDSRVWARNTWRLDWSMSERRGHSGTSPAMTSRTLGEPPVNPAAHGSVHTDMRLTSTLLTACLASLATTPAIAQRRAYDSASTPTHTSPLPARALALPDFFTNRSAGSLLREPLSLAHRGRMIDSPVVVQPACPMPVLRPDSARLEPMPVVHADSTMRPMMPVARSTCRNPLQR